mmetsp:Transcript_25810/g.60508  ORF Transcript_25810/g.60508 Transcript_25810/m.60508 type:complete len:207 (-) Transcript_25810:498-1118(-)
MGIELKLSAKFLKTALNGFTKLGGSSDGHRKSGVFLEKSLEDVQNVGRHGTLGGESAKDAHKINEVANEGDGNDLVDCLRQIVEGQRQIGENIGVRGDKWKRTGRCGKETSVLSKIEKGDSGGRSSQCFQTISEGVPFSNRFLSVFSALIHQKFLESRFVTDGESPVSFRGPETQALVGFDGHGFLEDIEDHSQRIQRRLVESLED